jgi:hypothetical protein
MHPRRGPMRKTATTFVGMLAMCGTVTSLPASEDKTSGGATGAESRTDENRPVRLVGGTPLGEVVKAEDGKLSYTCGPLYVDSPLPVGYPPPTAPGALELKRYPSVRRAEYGGTDGSGARGFFPLFRHISTRDIAMTAPVEMDYGTDGSTMSFLYRVPELGPTGKAENGVVVVDTEPALVLSIGVRGTRNGRTVSTAQAALDDWLDRNPGYRSDGRVRWMGYNGPSVPVRNQWWELQMFVSPVNEPDTDTASTNDP